MKREERVEQIIKIAKAKKLNISTIVFLLAMTSDKGLSGVYNQIKNFANNEVIKFSKRIQIPDEYEEKTFIIPDSEYRVKKNTKKGYKGWIVLTGVWQTKTSTFGGALSFSPSQFDKLKKFIK